MLRRIQQRLGTAGFVLSVVALFVALGGGAYAASGALTGKQKKEVTKIAQIEAKKFAGKQGAPGSTGAQGPAGTAGANGKDGANGAAGVGIEGKQGAEGKQGEPGKAGKNGLTGFTKTLPSGETETGVWGTAPASEPGAKDFPISFPIPLSEAPEVVIVGPTKESEPGCPGRGGGTFSEGYEPTTPEAEDGKLCIYEMTVESGVLESAFNFKYSEGFHEWEVTPGASNSGTELKGSCSSVCSLGGTWAVTGPQE
jgi:hypothetical protein